MWLLDTNVISELRKARLGRAQPAFSNWLSRTTFPASYISVVTVFEVERGFLALYKRDPVATGRLRNSVEATIRGFALRVLDIDEGIARRCAALHLSSSKPQNDAWIAATALDRNLTVVTRNLADFQDTGVRLLNPWGPA